MSEVNEEAIRLSRIYGLPVQAFVAVAMPAEVQERDQMIARIASAYGVTPAAVRQVLEKQEAGDE